MVDGARRRIRLWTSGAESRASEAPDTPVLRDVEVAMTRQQLGRLVAHLSPAPKGSAAVSPAGLALILTQAITNAGGQGRPIVTRSPAGLHTPEYWRVRIEAADAAARHILERASATGGSR
jgi:hypothetical protein